MYIIAHAYTGAVYIIRADMPSSREPIGVYNSSIIYTGAVYIIRDHRLVVGNQPVCMIAHIQGQCIL